MANPNPQHVPTDGLNVAAYVQVTGDVNLTNCASGGTTVATEATPNDTRGLNGQGYGAVASSKHPCAQYALTLSLSGATLGGKAYYSTSNLTAVIKDVANTTYTAPVNTAVWKSYNNPTAASWYKPSNGLSGNGLLANQKAYSANIASVASTGQLTALVTGLAIGQAIVEVQFPTFDDVMSPELDHDTSDPTMMVYCQIVVTVVP
jgi:hypothetical protein